MIYLSLKPNSTLSIHVKMKIKFGHFLLTATLAAFLYSCGNSADQATEETVDESAGLAEEAVPQKVVYYGTPSLVEVVGIMKSSGATFSKKLLNDPANSTNYSTHYQKALNLGVYGADLTYSAMFDETQDAINYLKTVKVMAEEIGLTGAFEADFLTNIEKNITDRDALLDVITDFYWSADAYLTDNERMDVSSLIITGGWIESMHIACDMAHRSPKNTEIRKRIAEQKLILKNLILFLESAAPDDANVAECIGELKGIQAIYNDVKVNQGSGNSVTDEQKGETVIGNETDIEMSQEQLDMLCGKFDEIRTRFVKF